MFTFGLRTRRADSFALFAVLGTLNVRHKQAFSMIVVD
jgi:hypothetical protein